MAIMYWKARQFGKLAELPDGRLFAELQTGLHLVAQNATRLADAAIVLSDQGRTRPARILASHATDEAGKFLLLMDAARCPRNHLQRHLRCATQHLARLLYAETAMLKPATFKELVGYINNNRASHYLDGPEGIEWVYRNSMLYFREQDLYVDYVEREDHSCAWQDPEYFDQLTGNTDALSQPHLLAVELVTSLVEAGLCREASLALLASRWRTFLPGDETTISELWRLISETKRDLETHGLAHGDADLWTLIVDRWTFPLWAADLSLREVKLSELTEEQERYSYE
jgi:AbiV family abortive infection protein